MTISGQIAKQTVVRQFGILLNNKKEWIIDTLNNLDNSLGLWVEEKKEVSKTQIIWFHLYNILW